MNLEKPTFSATHWVDTTAPTTPKEEAKVQKSESGEYQGPYSNPIYKQIALRNGEINRMTKDQIREKLGQLRLDTKGVKSILKKRLKNHYKKMDLMKAAVKPPTDGKPHYDYLLVIDYEATCQENNPSGFKYEIIEFPIVLVDTAQQKVVDEFQAYVKPVVNPRLSDFCVHLTGITQVDRSQCFADVMTQVNEWMDKHNLTVDNKLIKFAVVTDGPWDMARFLHLQCLMSKVPFPRWARKWINIRKSFSNFYGFRRSKLSVMLENMGLSFEGQQHSGIDDARNIARIAIRMLQDGADIKVNERLYAHKLRGLEQLDQLDVQPIAPGSSSSHSDSDTDCEENQKENQHSHYAHYHHQHHHDVTNCRSCTDHDHRSNFYSTEKTLSNAFTNMSIHESVYNQPATRQDENVDDLLAYYALQNT